MEAVIPLWGEVKDRKTFMYKDRARTMLFGVISQWSQKSRDIEYLNNKYKLLFN